MKMSANCVEAEVLKIEQPGTRQDAEQAKRGGMQSSEGMEMCKTKQVKVERCSDQACINAVQVIKVVIAAVGLSRLLRS